MTEAKIDFDALFGKAPHAIAVATSGGADSMCLTLLAQQWAQQQGVKLVSLIVDHRLRPESSAEATTTQHFLHTQGIEAHILPWDGIKPKSNIHQIAREARYTLLCAWCKQHNIPYLLTAHNMEDQAETVLMRIKRGSGVDGLCGIPSTTERHGIKILRPLLHCARVNIINTLNAHNWPYVEDPSNQNTIYERTKIRQLLKQIDDNGLLTKRLILLSNNMQRTANFLHRQTEEALKNVAVLQSLGYITLCINRFINLDEEVALRVLVKVLNWISGHSCSPRLENLMLLYKQIQQQINRRTFWGCEMLAKAGQLYIWREEKAMQRMPQHLQLLAPGEHFIWDHRFIIQVNEPKLYVGATGQKGWQDIKKYTSTPISIPKVIYTTPAIFDDKGEIIAHPLLDVYKHKCNAVIQLRPL